MKEENKSPKSRNRLKQINNIRSFPGALQQKVKTAMTKDSFDEEEERSGNTVNKTVLVGLVRIVIVAAIVILCICAIYIAIWNHSYNAYDVEEETGVQNASMVDYVPYQKSLLKYSKDGAVFIDEKGEAVWNETFVMKMPMADVSGEYVAVADLNGNDVYIFDSKGKVSSNTMPYRVCDIAVAGQGEFAVILENGKVNYINIYDRNGEQISEIQTTLDKSGYPMDIDLSADGEKLFSTYMRIDGVMVRNELAAYNFGSVGQNENADRLMGGYQLEDTVVSKVEFLDNNTICAFGDNQFIIYSMKEKPSQKAVIPFTTEIESVIFNSDYIGAIVPKVNGDGEILSGNELQLYNTSGHRVMTMDVDFDYTKVKLRGEEIIFTGGNECRIYTLKGRPKFICAFSKNVLDIVPTGYGNRYIALYDNGSEIIRLKHESEQEKK